VITVEPRTIGELVEKHGGTLDAAIDVSQMIARVGASDRREGVDLSPVLHARGAVALASDAWVLLVAKEVEARVPPGRRWIHPRADLVLAELLTVDEPDPIFDMVHGARIARSAEIGEGVRIAPFAVIFAGVRLGARVIIGEGAVIGRPGFGFAEGPIPVRIPHRAGVVLEDDVEIGALCTVDAGVLVPTRIGAHTKLDAHVHVGHGVSIGARCRVAAQVGFAGSVVVEDDVRIGGQAGIADHVRIGRGARIAAKAGVIGDVPEGAVFAGYPAVARARWLRGHARLYRK
jgi:UDP-3-O-[3-hydroxymyristoyl] glucosamine N-acyltransferase